MTSLSIFFHFFIILKSSPEGEGFNPPSLQTLKPGAHHIMLMGLQTPLKKGDTFSLTLDFGKAGSCTLEVPVQDGGYQDGCGCNNH